jgi:hypothetical protein
MEFTTEELEEIKRLLDVRYNECTERVIASEIDGKKFRVDYHAVQRTVLSASRKVHRELSSRALPPNKPSQATVDHSENETE